MTGFNLHGITDGRRSPGSSPNSATNACCDLGQATSTFCQMGVLGQGLSQGPSSAMKTGLGESGNRGSGPSGPLKSGEEALGTLVQPSCCHWGYDGHELVLGSLAYPSLPPQMDPVQKAVLSHTFGGPLLKTKRPIISCNVCQIRFNSQVRFSAIHASSGWGRWNRGCGASCGRVGLGALGEGWGLRGSQRILQEGRDR